MAILNLPKLGVYKGSGYFMLVGGDRQGGGGLIGSY